MIKLEKEVCIYMAMIKCPECGKDVSDRAKVCPNCAYPLEEMANFGKIRIKLNTQTNGFKSKQKVTITDKSGSILWEGKSGEVADLEITTITDISIKYHTSFMVNLWGGSTEGIIDPNKWCKYNVTAKKGLVSNIILDFYGTDIFDSD